MKQGVQCNRAELDRRIDQVMRQLFSGWTTTDIVQFVAKEWGRRTRCAHRYIRLARDRMERYTIPEREALIREGAQRFDDLYRRSLEVEDFKACRQIARDKLDLLIGTPAQTITLGGSLEVSRTVLFDEIAPGLSDNEKAALCEHLAKVAKGNG